MSVALSTELTERVRVGGGVMVIVMVSLNVCETVLAGVKDRVEDLVLLSDGVSSNDNECFVQLPDMDCDTDTDTLSDVDDDRLRVASGDSVGDADGVSLFVTDQLDVAQERVGVRLGDSLSDSSRVAVRVFVFVGGKV